MGTYYGGSAEDSFRFDTGVNTAYGLGGADQFSAAGDSSNSLFGGEGDDRFTAETWGFDDQGTLNTTNLFDGGAGTDTVELYFLEQYAVLGPRIDLVAQTITFSSSRWPTQTLVSIENVIGSDNDDVIFGNELNNRLHGAAGDDDVYGNAGDDEIIGGYGYDVLYGGDGNDVIDAGYDWYATGHDEDELYGDAGDDRLIGSDWADALYGGMGNDELNGDYAVGETGSFWGNDALYGGDGADSLYGGQGNDSLNGGAETNLFYGGSGNDTAQFTGLRTSTRIDLATGVASLPGTTSLSETLVSIENVEGGSGADVLIGAADNNRLLGNLGADTIAGAAGDDELYGGEGDDGFDGGAGADRLFGGEGNDRLLGGSGIDWMDGGAGVDTVVTSGTAAVRINLGLGQQSFPGTQGVETLIAVENATSSSGVDVLVGSAGVNILRGAGGADRLTGGGGADVLVGGAQNDTFEFLTAVDSVPGFGDRIEAGEGATAFQNAGSLAGDRIDLAAIDANTTLTGNQLFKFGTATGTGRLWVVEVGSITHIRANTDADAVYEFELAIVDGAVRSSVYSASDFIL